MRRARSCGRRSSGAISGPKPNAGGSTDTIGADATARADVESRAHQLHAAKLLWVRTHEPDAWRRVRHVLLPKDFVRLRLSGEYATDVADASGTLMLDVAHRRWSQEMIDAAGIDSRCCRGYSSRRTFARASRQRRPSDTGLVEGTPIVAGAGDQAAGAVGMGITRPGAVSATIGTSGVVFAATDRPALDPGGRLHTFCHAIPDRWHLMGVTQAAGPVAALDSRAARTEGRSATMDTTLMTREAAAIAPGRRWRAVGALLDGRAHAASRSGIRAALVGLAANHTRGHIVRAVLEGVAFSLRDSFTIFSELGVPVQRVRLGGGGARSAAVARDSGGRVRTRRRDGGCRRRRRYGAALLAGVGAGVWPSVDEACDRLVRARLPLRRTRPCRVHERAYAAYRRIYPALRSIAVSFEL